MFSTVQKKKSAPLIAENNTPFRQLSGRQPDRHEESTGWRQMNNNDYLLAIPCFYRIYPADQKTVAGCFLNQRRPVSGIA
jgi:hypothetical protein